MAGYLLFQRLPALRKTAFLKAAGSSGMTPSSLLHFFLFISFLCFKKTLLDFPAIFDIRRYEQKHRLAYLIVHLALSLSASLMFTFEEEIILFEQL